MCTSQPVVPCTIVLMPCSHGRPSGNESHRDHGVLREAGGDRGVPSGQRTHTQGRRSQGEYQGWKLAPACQPMADKFYVGPVEILSWLVKCPITSVQIVGFVSFRACRPKG